MSVPYRNRKVALLITIAISFTTLLIAAKIPDFGPPSQAANILYLRAIASLVGLASILLLWWQVVLGFRRTLSWWVVDLIWVNKIHQLMGKYGFLLIMIHPVLMYTADFVTSGLAAFGFDLAEPYYQFRMLGVIAFIILGAIWVTSALTRGKLGYRWWKRIHLAAYVVLALVFLHSQAIGTLLTVSPALKIYWWFLAITFAILVALRIAMQFGLARDRYKLLHKIQVTPSTYRYEFVPVGGSRVAPHMGQFVYLQVHPFGEAHPFTVSFYDIPTGSVTITAKQFGKFTENLAQLPEGTEVFIDGPYGVFTHEVHTTRRTPVFLAGGIGITPFLRHIFTGSRQDWYLIVGSQTEADMAYHQEILATGVPKERYVQVLSNQQTVPEDNRLSWETGFVTLDILHKYLGTDLTKYDFFVCGPPGMMGAMEKLFDGAGVPAGQVMMEKFSL